MWTGVWPADSGGDFLEILVKGRIGIMLPRFICEYEIVRIRPYRTRRKAVFNLPFLLSFEKLKRDGRWFNGTYFPAFCALGNILSAGRLGCLQLLTDGDPAAFKIDLFP